MGKVFWAIPSFGLFFSHFQSMTKCNFCSLFIYLHLFIVECRLNCLLWLLQSTSRESEANKQLTLELMVWNTLKLLFSKSGSLWECRIVPNKCSRVSESDIPERYTSWRQTAHKCESRKHGSFGWFLLSTKWIALMVTSFTNDLT